eukprot:31145-Pelagococcus_subviridis.AAC.7
MKRRRVRVSEPPRDVVDSLLERHHAVLEPLPHVRPPSSDLRLAPRPVVHLRRARVPRRGHPQRLRGVPPVRRGGVHCEPTLGVRIPEAVRDDPVRALVRPRDDGVVVRERLGHEPRRERGADAAAPEGRQMRERGRGLRVEIRRTGATPFVSEPCAAVGGGAIAKTTTTSASVAVDATERGIAWRPPPCRAMPNGL